MTVSIEPDPALVARFAADLDALVEPGRPIGVAVSGGADSLALLLLAAAARPGLTEAATVDHGLRAANRDEAAMVASVCGRLAVPHRTLTVEFTKRPTSNLQAWARDKRYGLLAKWASDRKLPAIATAHHADDQAETLLMRIARGAGVGGLASVQASRLLAPGIQLVRPVLDWRREELRQVVDGAALEPADDLSNSDERFDRTRARALLQATEWLDPRRLSMVASHASDAEQALDWAAMHEFDARSSRDGTTLALDAAGLPRDLRLRLLAHAIELLAGEVPPGPKLAAALKVLETGATTTLAGLHMKGGAIWRLSPAPPRTR